MFEPDDPYPWSVLMDYPEHLAGLGMIAAEWAALESTMCVALGAIINNLDAGDAILNTLGSHKAKADILRAVVRECLHDDELKALFETALQRIERSARRRNDLLHGLWSIWTLGGLPYQALRRPGTSTPSQSLKRTPDELYDFARKIAALNQELMRAAHCLMAKRDPSLAPSPYTPE